MASVQKVQSCMFGSKPCRMRKERQLSGCCVGKELAGQRRTLLRLTVDEHAGATKIAGSPPPQT